MNQYPLYESRMKSYGLEDMTAEDMIAQGMITEERIAEIEKELQTASAFETVSPIGYAYVEKRTTHYIIRFSREVNLHYPFLTGGSLLDFIAEETTVTEQYLKEIHTALFTHINNLPKDENGNAELDIKSLMFDIMEHQIVPKCRCRNSFFDFLTSLGYLQYVVDYFTPLLPPFETLKRYEKFIGMPMKLTKEEIGKIQEYEKDGTYDLEKSPYFDIVIHYTCDYLKRAKEQLSHDLGLLLEEPGNDTPRTGKTKDTKATAPDKNNNLPDTSGRPGNPTKDTVISPAVRLFLLEQQNKLSGSYLDTHFTTHLLMDHFVTELLDLSSFLQKKTSAQPEYETAPSVHEVYDIENINDWFRFELISLVRDNIPYKKCRTCGKFFIPAGRSDREYCSRFNPKYGKPCREIGATLTFENRHKDDRIHRAYTQAYRRMDSRKRTKYISRAEFAEWGRIAREKRNLCENGGISFDEFQAWLDETKRK